MGAREATRVLILAIGCTKYDVVRSLGDDFKGYCDIPQARTDVDSFVLGAKAIKGYREEDVTILIDPDFDGIQNALG